MSHIACAIYSIAASRVVPTSKRCDPSTHRVGPRSLICYPSGVPTSHHCRRIPPAVAARNNAFNQLHPAGVVVYRFWGTGSSHTKLTVFFREMPPLAIAGSRLPQIRALDGQLRAVTLPEKGAIPSVSMSRAHMIQDAEYRNPSGPATSDAERREVARRKRSFLSHAA